MPQASKAQRDLMEKWFGNRVSDEGPTAFLVSRGYTEMETGKPKLPVPAHSVSREEFACICFLVDEWDWDPPDQISEYNQ